MPNFVCSLNLQEDNANESFTDLLDPAKSPGSHQCHICTKCFPDEENLDYRGKPRKIKRSH